LIPPPNYGKGWYAFGVALAVIGLVTMFVGEVATIFGCVVGLKPSVTAITFVALGTSLPDTFASKTAAQTSEYADAAISNVTGSNCVNVFLGLGLPWVILSMY
jgi:Ca2+/Na+ antiporter